MRVFLSACLVYNFVLCTVAALSASSLQSRNGNRQGTGLYYVHMEPRSWNDAQEYCAIEGTSLFYPKTLAEAKLVVELLQEKFPNGTESWVGAYNLFLSSSFVDLNGNKISDYFAPWAPNNPSHGFWYGTCVMMHPDGTIGDYQCSDWKPFVCKRDNDKRTTYNGKCDTYDAVAEPQFRKDYRYIETLDSFYKAHHERRSWYDAYHYCNIEGGSLFYPISTEELDIALGMMEKSFWVGAHALLGRDIYVDLKDNDISQYKHTKWAPEEPNHYSLRQGCIAMHKNGTISDFACENINPFICKGVAQNTTYNSACDTWDPAYVPNKNHTRCYKFHTTPKTWTDAYITCHGEQSYLAIVNDKEEANFITKGAKAAAENIRGDYVRDFIGVGYHDKFEEGKYVTVHGQSLDTIYHEWDKGEPSNSFNNEDCGTIKTNGLLNDFNCDLQRVLFVCERDLPQSTVGATVEQI